MGHRQGFDDRRGRGKLIYGIIEYLTKKQPRVFVLENVAAIMFVREGKSKCTCTTCTYKYIT